MRIGRHEMDFGAGRLISAAEGLNVLSAAWIQFQNHGWFGHGQNSKETLEIELHGDDDWPEDPMLVERTIPDRTRDPEDPRPSTFLNTVTHWWDGSQIYGSSQAQNKELRTGEDGKMILVDGKLLFMAVPRLAEEQPFFLLDPARLDVDARREEQRFVFVVRNEGDEIDPIWVWLNWERALER